MAPKREHRPGDIVVPPVWEGTLTFGPSREPVGAGDGDTFVVRACGRCGEKDAEIARLKDIIRRIEARTRAGDTLQQRTIGVRVLCKEALGWNDSAQAPQDGKP